MDFYILKTPLYLCLETMNPPCKEKVVGAFIRTSNPYAVHPHCAKHTNRPAVHDDWEDSWEAGLVQQRQEFLIAASVPRSDPAPPFHPEGASA